MKKWLPFLLAVTLPFVSLAHGYWMEIKGSGKVNEPVSIRLYFGEYISGERLSGHYLDRMKEIKLYVRGQEIAMKQLNDYWEGQYTPAAEGSYTIVAVNEEREVQDWTKHNLGIVRPVQYLKAVYEVGTPANDKGKEIFLNTVVTRQKDNDYHIGVLKNNAPFAEAIITITHPDGEETVLNGSEKNFTAPKPGLYVIDIEWTDKTAGQFKGKDFASVRYKLDYSLYH